jgi:DNA-binding transcriptional MerR regulator
VTNERLRAVAAPDAGDPRRELTIEQLAYETGMSVRNIRNHQSRGLLPPPEVRARVGYYGSEHVARLRLIQELQADGLNLAAIKRLIGDRGDAADGFLGLRRAVTAPFENETPEVLTVEELAERFGPAEPKRLARAERLGALVPLGDGRYEVPSPALLRAAEELVARGVSLDAALAVLEKLRRNAESVSRAFVRLFLDEVWKPFEASGRPDERFAEITEAIERLRPLASEALLAVFKQTMAAEVEDAFGKVLERQGAKRGR